MSMKIYRSGIQRVEIQNPHKSMVVRPASDCHALEFTIMGHFMKVPHSEVEEFLAALREMAGLV